MPYMSLVKYYTDTPHSCGLFLPPMAALEYLCGRVMNDSFPAPRELKSLGGTLDGGAVHATNPPSTIAKEESAVCKAQNAVDNIR